MKTSELTGAALDWAVAICEGWKTVHVNGVLMLRHYHPEKAHTPHCYVEDFGYSTNWAQGGPIIEREKIRLDTTWNFEDGYWSARMDTVGGWWLGDTPLVAAMRCYVASQLGDTVDIPEELL
jgi:hypothetical protein